MGYTEQLSVAGTQAWRKNSEGEGLGHGRWRNVDFVLGQECPWRPVRNITVVALRERECWESGWWAKEREPGPSGWEGPQGPLSPAERGCCCCDFQNLLGSL